MAQYQGHRKALYKNAWGDYEFATRRNASGWGDMYRRHTRITMLDKMECDADKATTPPTDATASIENAEWYAVADDSTGSGGTTSIRRMPGRRALESQNANLYFDSKEQAVFVRYKKNGREYRYRVSGSKQ